MLTSSPNIWPLCLKEPYLFQFGIAELPGISPSLPQTSICGIRYTVDNTIHSMQILYNRRMDLPKHTYAAETHQFSQDPPIQQAKIILKNKLCQVYWVRMMVYIVLPIHKPHVFLFLLPPRACLQCAAFWQAATSAAASAVASTAVAGNVSPNHPKKSKPSACLLKIWKSKLSLTWKEVVLWWYSWVIQKEKKKGEKTKTL